MMDYCCSCSFHFKIFIFSNIVRTRAHWNAVSTRKETLLCSLFIFLLVISWVLMCDSMSSLMWPLVLFASLCSSHRGLHGEKEPEAVAKQPASCQDGLRHDAALHTASGVCHVHDSQVLKDLIMSVPFPRYYMWTQSSTTVPCSTVQYSVVLCSTVQCSTVQCSTNSVYLTGVFYQKYCVDSWGGKNYITVAQILQ